MSIIHSVLGPLDAKAPVFTLMHEHVACRGFVAQNYPELFGDGFMDGTSPDVYADLIVREEREVQF